VVVRYWIHNSIGTYLHVCAFHSKLQWFVLFRKWSKCAQPRLLTAMRKQADQRGTCNVQLSISLTTEIYSKNQCKCHMRQILGAPAPSYNLKSQNDRAVENGYLS
jgi:hypothetical protein